MRASVNRYVVMRLGLLHHLNRVCLLGRVVDDIIRLTVSIRAKVEHQFRVVRRKFGLARIRYCGLSNSKQLLSTLFALSNVWMALRTLLVMDGAVHPSAEYGTRNVA